MNKKMEELIRIYQEFPGLEIKLAVYNDVCLDDSHAWCEGEITRIEKCFYYKDGDGFIYIDEDDISERFEYYEYDDALCDETFSGTLDEFYSKMVADGIIKEAIFVYIG